MAVKTPKVTATRPNSHLSKAELSIPARRAKATRLRPVSRRNCLSRLLISPSLWGSGFLRGIPTYLAPFCGKGKILLAWNMATSRPPSRSSDPAGHAALFSLLGRHLQQSNQSISQPIASTSGSGTAVDAIAKQLPPIEIRATRHLTGCDQNLGC
jgi:hypothetical protein